MDMMCHDNKTLNKFYFSFTVVIYQIGNGEDPNPKLFDTKLIPFNIRALLLPF